MRVSVRQFEDIVSGKSKKVKGPKETEIQNAMRQFLQMYGWFVIRHQQGLGCYKGLSDLTALKDGWTVYVEAKTATGKLSEDQKGFKDDVIRNGGTYVIGRCIEDVQFLCKDNVELLRKRWSGKCVGDE